MLLRFGVKNLRSIRDRQELSLVASSLRDSDEGLIETRLPGVRLLPAVLIYGPNASGKSNIVAALRWMRSMVLDSHSRGRPDGGVPRRPFALAPESAHATTGVDIDFIVGDVLYHYGFEANDVEFAAEWLYALPNNRRQLLFDRKGMDFEFGRNLKGKNKTISELTRPNSLYLSAAIQNGHEDLTSIGAFFRDLDVRDRVHTPDVQIGEELSNRTLDQRVIDFLARAGAGVCDFRASEVQMPKRVAEFQAEFIQLLRKLDPDVDVPNLSTDRWEPQLGHMDSEGRPRFFDLSDESEGTRRLLFLLTAMLRDLERNATMVIDELDASLHTQACEALLALFSSRSTNLHGAQLIATTHDTNLLRSELLRRDQIWFTEKDNAGATNLYPLTDIRTRKQDNIARGYLQGRYGAIPFAGPVADLLSIG